MQIASTVLAYIIVSSLLAVAVAVLLWLVSFLVKEALLNFDEARDLLKTFSTNPARE
jgi:type IV secretory pathway VirB3-like protein